MRIGAVFVSDRGDKYLPNCLESFWQHVDPALVDGTFIVDDQEHRLGMAGAVREAWSWAIESDIDYLWHCEEDFRFNNRIPLARMADLLYRYPHLAQLVLKRNPWSPEEKAAGGQMEVDPGAFTERDGFVEHRKLFSLNPCLIPRRTLDLSWVSTEHGVERDITTACEAAGMMFAYYGRRGDPPRCEHVGTERASGWRL